MSLADGHLMEAGRSVLVVVDVQEAFMPVMHDTDGMLNNIRRLLACARICRVPVIATTQYAEKLGPIHQSLLEFLDGDPIDKLTFSCMGSPQFKSSLKTMPDRTQVAICGLETHVCVNQTVHDLLDEGYLVHVAADAVTSRTELNWKHGLVRMDHVGATISSSESVIFEWLRRAGTPEFKEAAAWIKNV